MEYYRTRRTAAFQILALRTGDRHHADNFAENRADTASDTWNNCACADRDKSRHQSIFDQVLSLDFPPDPGAPDPRAPDQPADRPLHCRCTPSLTANIGRRLGKVKYGRFGPAFYKGQQYENGNGEPSLLVFLPSPRSAWG